MSIDPVVLRVAKSAILSAFDESYTIDKAALLEQYPFLADNGAVFVTLHYHKDLRGCIGSLSAHRKLLEDIIHNALSAAFEDPRFAPLREDELPHITLEVSLLSKPEILEYENFEDLLQKVRPKKDGLILQHGVYRGTFLPQVWDQLPTPELFLEHLSLKAGANPSIFAHRPAIYRYSVDSIEEGFEKIEVLL